MSEYVIYKVNMTESQQKKAFSEPFDAKKLQQRFDRLFVKGGSLKLHKLKNKNVEDVQNDIFIKHGDITILRINNQHLFNIVRQVKSDDGEVEYEEISEESVPYSYVIIDNRPGMCQIAIEKSSAWNSNTVMIRDILQGFFSEAMSYFGTYVTIDAKMSPDMFWEFIHKRELEGDRITSITIGLKNGSKSNMEMPVGKKSRYLEMIACLAEFEEAIGGVRQAHTIYGGKGKSMKLDNTNRDLANLVNICCNNAYDLKVKFARYGLYKCNDNIRAIYSLDEEVINDFKQGNQILGGGTELERWLDDILEKTKNYECEKEKPGKKARRK